MFFYEVAPAASFYQAAKLLTYNAGEELQIGQVLQAQLNRRSCLVVVIRQSATPNFKTVSLGDKLNVVLSATQVNLLLKMRSYYPSSLGSLTQLFLPGYIKNLPESLKAIKPPAETQPKSQSLVELTPEQKRALKEINQADNRSIILHGVTGSGKTRIYLELTDQALKRSKSVLLLTPEIALTAPLAEQFRDRFGPIVHVNHSSLTPKNKANLFRSVQHSAPSIVIGPRSSLFLPLNNLGLIIVDEFHENAYRNESAPHYHANRVASMLARLTASQLIFGSATPPIADYYLAKQKNAPIVELKLSAITRQKPKLNQQIVDLKQPEERTNYPLITKTTLQKITAALSDKKQVLLYLNKRGSARSIICQDCGWRALCPNCELPLSYHHDKHINLCHVCGLQSKVQSACPVCASSNIHLKSPGTKAIVQSLAKLFPAAKIVRYDKDNKKNEKIENTFEQLKSGNVDIIVGTQMIAKGFDLPKLAVVVIITAENSLQFPDFSAKERTYQVITQLSGRVNRGHTPGEVIIQTFSPEMFNPNQNFINWDDFYLREIEQRSKLGFPPTSFAMKIQAARKNPKNAKKILDQQTETIKKDYPNFKILGPAPSFVEKSQGKYSWQIILLAKNRSQLLKCAGSIKQSLSLEIDPANFL